MADYRVRWTSINQTVEVDLFDTLGPMNRYKFSDPNAVVPSEGHFTNQIDAVPVGGGWVMNGFDNGKTYPANGSEEDKGMGTIDITHIGTFPKGKFNWEVITKL